MKVCPVTNRTGLCSQEDGHGAAFDSTSPDSAWPGASCAPSPHGQSCAGGLRCHTRGSGRSHRLHVCHPQSPSVLIPCASSTAVWPEGYRGLGSEVSPLKVGRWVINAVLSLSASVAIPWLDPAYNHLLLSAMSTGGKKLLKSHIYLCAV